MFGLQLFTAFIIAAVFALAELVTTKYPRTIGLFWRQSRALWTYAIVYGLVALFFAAAYAPLTKSGVLHFQIAEPTESNSATAPGSKAIAAETRDESRSPTRETKEGAHQLTWLAAIMIGLSTKALLHIRLFSVPSTGKQEAFPVGTETVVQIFEPWLLRTILLDEYNAVSTYLKAKAARYPVLADVQREMVGNLPAANGFPQAERAALEVDIRQAASVRLAMEFYLRVLGVTALNKLFP